MKELRAKIVEALISALPITAIVYLMALLPFFDFDMSQAELITPIAIEKGLRFAIREGGRTVGSGVVIEITE